MSEMVLTTLSCEYSVVTLPLLTFCITAKHKECETLFLSPTLDERRPPRHTLQVQETSADVVLGENVIVRTDSVNGSSVEFEHKITLKL